MLRWFNMANQNVSLSIRPAVPYTKMYRSNLIEENVSDIDHEGNEITTTVKGSEIFTLALKGGQRDGSDNSHDDATTY